MHWHWFPLVGLFAVASGFPLDDTVPLRVQDVRLEPAPQLDGPLLTLMNFGLSNEGAEDLTHIVVEVTIVEKPVGSGVGVRSKVLAGPYTIVGKNVLRPGQTLNFEILLRNLSSDCGCVARVHVVSARSTRDTGADHDPVPAFSPKETDPPASIHAAVM